MPTHSGSGSGGSPNPNPKLAMITLRDSGPAPVSNRRKKGRDRPGGDALGSQAGSLRYFVFNVFAVSLSKDSQRKMGTHCGLDRADFGKRCQR